MKQQEACTSQSGQANIMPPEQSTFNNDTPVQARLDQEGKPDSIQTFQGHQVFSTSRPRRSFQQS